MDRRSQMVMFHDLRHYYASLLIQHDEGAKVMQRRLGHKSAVETLDTHSHLWPDSEDRTREAVDHVLGRPPETGGMRCRAAMCATGAPGGRRRTTRAGQRDGAGGAGL